MEKQQMGLDTYTRELFMYIQTDLPNPMHIPDQKLERVTNEFLFLSIFLIDLGVYFALQDTRERHVVMDSFWDLVNASGLDMDVLNSRIEAYSEAVRGDTREESLVRLGKTFAWHCLMQDDANVASFAEQESHRLLDAIEQFASTHEVAL